MTLDDAGLRHPSDSRRESFSRAKLHAGSFDLFYGVDMLERLHPDAAPVGGDGPYAREVVRFRHDPSLAFSTSDVTRVEHVEHSDGRPRFEITTTFLGLSGAVSPLPLYLAEELAQNQDAEPIAQKFLDLFHHRLVSFVYRIGTKYDIARGIEGRDPNAWPRRVLALCGIDLNVADGPLSKWQLLRLAPLLAMGVRSARVLELAIQNACGDALKDASVRIHQFRGGWVPLDRGARIRLGVANHRLGQTTVVGKRCVQRAAQASIAIGPLGRNFYRFTRGGDLHRMIGRLCLMLGDSTIEFELELQLELQLEPGTRPAFKLGSKRGACLGVDTFLAGRSSSSHVRVPLIREGNDDERPSSGVEDSFHER